MRINFLQHIEEKYRNEIHIYTDGSKTDTSSAFGAVSEDEIIAMERLPKEASIFTAKLNAIVAALKWVEEKDRQRKTFAVLSDPKSSLEALKNSTRPLIRPANRAEWVNTTAPELHLRSRVPHRPMRV